MISKRISQIRIGIVGAVLLAGGLIYLLLPVIAVRWARTPFPGFLLDPNLVVNAASESHWPAKQLNPPITYPGRLVAVNGQPLASNKEFYEILANHSVGDEVRLTFVQPQDPRLASSPTNPAEFTVTVPLILMNSNDLWNQFWLFYLVGFVILVIGAWTFYVRPDAEAAQVFTLLTTLGALAVGSLFDLVTTQYFVRLWIVALSIFGGLNLLLAVIFPHEISLVGRYPHLKWLVLLPGIVVCAWGQVWLHRASDPWAYAIPWRAAYALNGLALVASLMVMAYRGFRSPSPMVRQQGRIILWGAIVAFAPLIIFFTAASIPFQLEWLTQAMYIPPVVIYPLAIGYTIIRYRLWDVDIVLRRGFTYALLTGLLVGAFTLVVTGLAVALGPGLTMGSPILLAIFVVIVAIVFDPLRSRLQRGIDQYFFRQPVAFDELLRAYNRELTRAVNADQVATVLLKYVNKGVLGTTPQLYLSDGQSGCYSSYANNSDSLVDSDSPLVQYMRGEPAAIDLAEERAWPPIFRQHREATLALDASVLVPLNGGQELLGWLALPRKKTAQYFTRTEITYLSSLANQSLIGLERATVIRRLEARVAELDLLSQFSQHLNFTVAFGDLLELVYTNYRRLLGIEDFFIFLRDPDTQQIYTAFYVEKDERLTEREGQDKVVTDPRIHQVVNTGQTLVTQDEHGRSWIAAPLNAGAETLGVIHTFAHQPGVAFRLRQQQLFGVFADRTAVALDRLQTRRQLEGRARQLEIINQVTLSLASTLELKPLLNLILDKAIELLDTEAGTFMLSVEDTGELEFQVVRGPASQDLLGNRLPIGTGLAGTAAQTGRPVLVNQVSEDKRWFAQVDASTDFETHSILTVPLLRQGSVLGVVQVINKRNGAPFDEEDLQLLAAFAGQAVVALENARLLEQTDQALQERVLELFLLQQLDRDLNTTLELDRVLTLTLDWALRICNGTAGAIVLIDAEGQPRIRATHGYDESFSPQMVDSATIKSGLVGRVLESSEPHVTGNVHEDPSYIAASFTTRSQMTLPVVHKQNLIGAIAVESDRFNAFDESAVETAVRVTNHAAVAIANAILYEQVNEANLAKSEFVSMVSHELKTPMTSMRGYTDLLLSGMTGEINAQQRNFLETIAANIKRMGQQIQDLTDISRIETGRLHVELAPIVFANVISETLPTIRGLCEEKGIELHLDLPADLPRVMGDKERLIQVLTNLLSNACKYSPPHTNVYVALRPEMISLKEGEPAQAMVVCTVRDQGYGISEEDLQRLFTKFFRSEDPNIRKATGTGLGLSITKGIVELHGGRIWVESKPGEETTFYVVIPQVQE